MTLQPNSLTNQTGSTVSFSATAVGTGTLAYQWYFNSSPLSGATSSSLTLTNATAGETGFYDLVVTNNYGSVTSSIVALVLTNGAGSTNVVSVCDEADLQAAINAGGWIRIGCSGTIVLTNTLTINNRVILDGSGVSATLSGGSLVRLFSVAPGASLTLTNLTLANGFLLVTNGTTPATGAAICNNGGTVTATSCTLENNSAQALLNGGVAEGGAVFNNGGSVFLYGTSLSANTVVGGAYISGGINSPPGGLGLGGALFTTNGSVVVSQCAIIGNACTGAGGGGGMSLGGGLYQASGGLVITNTLLSTNLALGGNAVFYGMGSSSETPAASASGGALAAAAGTVVIEQCQFAANTAQGGSQGINDPSPLASGGAVYSQAKLILANSSFCQNQALSGGSVVPLGSDITGDGGAIYNAGTAIMNGCCVWSNLTEGASASVYHSQPELGGDGLGGGLFNASVLSATNCTFALNFTVNGSGSSGGANGKSLGAGIYNSVSGAFTAVNVTLASNACLLPVAGTAAGSQIVNATNGSVKLLNSLIAYGGSSGNAYGVITDLGDNISSDGSANFQSGSSYNFTDPLLGPLANNGGPTLTMALLTNSPAIAYADSTDGAPPDDQRGYARPTGTGVIDLGAYQSGATQIYTPPPSLNLSISAAGTNVLVTFTATAANTYHLQSSTNLTVWTDVATFGAFSSPSNVSQTVSQQGATRRFFRVWW